MSLINQMLKDLEQRSKRSMNTEFTLPVKQESVLYGFEKKYYKYSLYGIIIFVSLMMIYLILQLSMSIHHKTMAASRTSDAGLLAVSTTPAWTPQPIRSIEHIFDTIPATLTGINMQYLNNTTQLRFALNKNVLYRVIQNDSQQLVIILENAKLIATIPEWDTTNSSISALDISNQKNGDIKLIMKLNEGAELSKLMMNTTGSAAELQIDVVNKVPFDAQHNSYVMDSPTASIKKMHLGVPLEEEYRDAMQISHDGRTNQSIIMLTEILAKDPEYYPARESLATLLVEQGNTEKALGVIKTGLQQRPFYPPYIQLKAKILVDQKKVAQALNLLQIAPPALKDYPDYHAFIAALYQRSGKPVLAQQIYEDLLELQPTNGIWWMGLAIAYESLGNLNQATNAFLKAINSDNLDPESKAYAESRVKSL